MKKLRNKTPNCETNFKPKNTHNSRFNALKHGGYATVFYQLPSEEREKLLNQKSNTINLLK